MKSLMKSITAAGIAIAAISNPTPSLALDTLFRSDEQAQDCAVVGVKEKDESFEFNVFCKESNDSESATSLNDSLVEAGVTGMLCLLPEGETIIPIGVTGVIYVYDCIDYGLHWLEAEAAGRENLNNLNELVNIP